MDKTIVEFIDALRGSGVRISLSENIDCFRALEVLGIEDKPTFKSALRSTLIKKASDISTFEKLFEMYFTSLTKPLLDEDDETVGGGDQGVPVPGGNGCARGEHFGKDHEALAGRLSLQEAVAHEVARIGRALDSGVQKRTHEKDGTENGEEAEFALAHGWSPYRG